VQPSGDTFPDGARQVDNTAECFGPEGHALHAKLENMEAILAAHPGTNEEKEPLRMRLQALRSTFENMRAQYGVRLSEARARNRIAAARLEGLNHSLQYSRREGPHSSGMGTPYTSSASSDRMRTPSPEWERNPGRESAAAANLFSPAQIAGRGGYIDATP